MRVCSPRMSVVVAAAVALLSACASSGGAPGAAGTPGRDPTAAPPAAGPLQPTITAEDLKARLYAFAHDSMEGREFGERGGYKASEFLAAEAARIGLEPAGENGTWFQTVPTQRRSLDAGTSFGIAGRPFEPWADYVAIDVGEGVAELDGVGVIFGGTLGESGMAGAEAGAGKLVVVLPAEGEWPEPGQLLDRFPSAAGIALVTLEQVPAEIIEYLKQPAPFVGEVDTTARTALLWITRATAERLMGGPVAGMAPGTAGNTVTGTVRYRTSVTGFPSRNVVAMVRGSDPALAAQYVAIGAHSDHIGIAERAVDHDSLRAYNTVMRPLGADDPPGVPSALQAAQIAAIRDSLRALHPARRDSIANGADDDGSGSVALLEMAQALVAAPEKPRRSILFVWHTGEEAGLLGARYFTDNPTVPRDSIVTALNIDMIGRGGVDDVPGGGPSYLQLIGSRRLSRELGDLIETVNTEGGHGFRFDYQFDADGHPEQYYCRSDHYEYARYGIPVTFFSTGSHRDYHMLTDEAQYIDYAKLTAVTSLIHDVAVRVANLDHRPALSAPRPDPDGECVQ